MDSMPISKFKATCLATLDRVRRTGRPIRVTRFGKPMAEIIPPTPGPPQKDWMGKFAHTGKITGDLIEPSESFVKWEVNLPFTPPPGDGSFASSTWALRTKKNTTAI